MALSSENNSPKTRNRITRMWITLALPPFSRHSKTERKKYTISVMIMQKKTTDAVNQKLNIQCWKFTTAQAEDTNRVNVLDQEHFIRNGNIRKQM